MSEKWVRVPEYAKIIGKSVPLVYYDVKTGKIPKERTRLVERKDKCIEIKVED